MPLLQEGFKFVAQGSKIGLLPPTSCCFLLTYVLSDSACSSEASVRYLFLNLRPSLAVVDSEWKSFGQKPVIAKVKRVNSGIKMK